MTYQELAALVAEACPSFEPTSPAAHFLGDYLMADLAVHVARLVSQRQLQTLDGVFDLLESLMTQDDERIKDSIVFFFLEGLGKECKNLGLELSSLGPWFGPETTKWICFLKATMPGVMG